jgi:predicted NBD/HSP70 family sugar kinase
MEERHLAQGLYNTLLHWTPELVVFGGSMMRDIDLGVVGDELEKLPAVLVQLPRLERAALGDAAGLQGAVAWLRQLGY